MGCSTRSWVVESSLSLMLEAAVWIMRSRGVQWWENFREVSSTWRVYTILSSQPFFMRFESRVTTVGEKALAWTAGSTPPTPGRSVSHTWRPWWGTTDIATFLEAREDHVFLEPIIGSKCSFFLASRQYLPQALSNVEDWNERGPFHQLIHSGFRHSVWTVCDLKQRRGKTEGEGRLHLWEECLWELACEPPFIQWGLESVHYVWQHDYVSPVSDPSWQFPPWGENQFKPNGDLNHGCLCGQHSYNIPRSHLYHKTDLSTWVHVSKSAGHGEQAVHGVYVQSAWCLASTGWWCSQNPWQLSCPSSEGSFENNLTHCARSTPNQAFGLSINNQSWTCERLFIRLHQTLCSQDFFCRCKANQ